MGRGTDKDNGLTN